MEELGKGYNIVGLSQVIDDIYFLFESHVSCIQKYYSDCQLAIL